MHGVFRKKFAILLRKLGSERLVVGDDERRLALGRFGLVDPGDDLFDMEKARNDLREELEALVTTLDQNLDPDKSPAIEQALKIANLALERHA